MGIGSLTVPLAAMFNNEPLAATTVAAVVAVVGGSAACSAGLYVSNPVVTHSSKAPGFNTSTYQVISWIQAFAFNQSNSLVPLQLARVAVPRRALRGRALHVELY
jgi:hypothetical protein